MDRRVILGLVAAVAVVSAAVGWVAGQRIKSPAEIAADQEPPPPSLISVPVEFRTLSQNVVVRGTIVPSDETDLSVGAADGTAVITRIIKEKGDSIDEGDVLIEVAGRPVIALKGDLPAFRNLIPTLEGPDVRQLEEALVRLGYNPGDVDENYTTSTGSAVAEMYRDRGYSAPDADESDQAGLRSASAAVEAQEQALADANAALVEAQEPVPESERLQLDLAVAQAESNLEGARSEATAAKAAAATAVTEAQSARDAAAASGDSAALAEAEAALTAAQADQTRIVREQDLIVQTAEADLAVSKANRTERLAAPDLTRLRTQVSEASAALNDARSERSEAQARVGSWIPTTEVVFFSSVPRQVATLFAELGDIPTGAVMTISGADTQIESGVSSADRRLIEVGAEAVLEDADLGLSIPAVVSFIADNPGGGGLSEDRFAMRLEPTGEVPEDAINVNLRISIPITSSGGDVLAVPLAALSAGADGTARVEVERSPGQTTLVKVSTGLRADGFVEIESLEDPLEAGDRVVVGRDLVLPGSSTATGGDDSPDGESEETES